jgi:hypothetical protein
MDQLSCQRSSQRMESAVLSAQARTDGVHRRLTGLSPFVVHHRPHLVYYSVTWKV